MWGSVGRGVGANEGAQGCGLRGRECTYNVESIIFLPHGVAGSPLDGDGDVSTTDAAVEAAEVEAAEEEEEEEEDGGGGADAEGRAGAGAGPVPSLPPAAVPLALPPGLPPVVPPAPALPVLPPLAASMATAFTASYPAAVFMSTAKAPTRARSPRPGQARCLKSRPAPSKTNTSSCSPSGKAAEAQTPPPSCIIGMLPMLSPGGVSWRMWIVELRDI